MGIIKIMPCLDMKEGRVVKGISFKKGGAGYFVRHSGDGIAHHREESHPFYQLFKANRYAKLDLDENDLPLPWDHWNCTPISL